MNQKKELSKTYEPHAVEDKWINVWLASGIFSATSDDTKKEPYCIVIPPPNVTGSLHMGHALNTTIQDILIRYYRMNGLNTLWVLGTDHAGIATQNVVERKLKEEKKSRFDLGRKDFIKRVWKWREESGGTIVNQLKRLGASCDYKNERFTMDEGLSHAVKKVFVSLYQEGLIYRGERLINWCPRCHTALSDLEVEHSEQKGHLWHMKYPLSTGDHLIIATTRPETMLGDTAVAVHPEDERYKNLIGQKVGLPLTDREIKVIADEYVDRDFGSGVVKITPAHDFNDFEIGNRHHLERINILTIDGKINENGLKYQGLSVEKAREQVVSDLESLGLLEKIEDYKNSVGHCYRCKTIVEPFLSHQWFVKTKPLAEKAMDAVKNGETRFVPSHWEKTYFNWMENIQDWCISRQIWWGHQIPAWYCSTETCSPLVSETPPIKCPTCGSTDLKQDEDVLDTWFSSALWPFSTLGWPDMTPQLKMFYPTTVLVTAFDIIFFWVARMMMMGIHFMGKVPFKEVHIHALVRDPTGQKMSKSKGNVVDPLLMMKEYGTDAFRFTLAALAAQGRDIKLDVERIEGYRNFCNKIWNASRFAMMNALPYIKEDCHFHHVEPKHRMNQWILKELSDAIQETRAGIENYAFNRSAHAVYKFFWNDFCDWYIELSKEIYRSGSDEEKIETAQTTFYVLDCALKLMHPFMPFITEEIWQMLADRGDESLVGAQYPKPLDTKKYQKSWNEVELLIDTVSAIRNIRQETEVPLKEEVSVMIEAPENIKKLYHEIKPMIFSLGSVKKLDFISGDPHVPSAIAKTKDCILSVPLEGLIDVEKERIRQTKKLAKIEKDIFQLNQRLNSSEFIGNAPPELVEEKKEQLLRAIQKKALIEKAIKVL